MPESRLINGLLGPTGSQVGCDECFRLLDAYVEREVEGHDAAATMPEMATHLAGCPVCDDEHRSLLELVRAERGGAAPR
jgi:hypothetical protein